MSTNTVWVFVFATLIVCLLTLRGVAADRYEADARAAGQHIVCECR